MSIKVMDMVWQNATDLQGNDLLVMLALADWANEQGACWPSVPKLAEKARVAERTVRYIIRRLEERGYIQIEEQRGRNHTNQYLLNLQVLQPKKVQPLQVSVPVKPASYDTQNLQVTTVKPAIAIAPNPSIEPSVKPSNKKSARATTIPADFYLTDDLRHRAEQDGIALVVDLDKHTERFIEYWTVGEGAGERKKNWALTWLNWMRREAERGGKRNGSNSKPTVSEVLTDIFRTGDTPEATDYRRLSAGGADVAYRRGA